jgi:cytidyltransferase-like protein
MKGIVIGKFYPPHKGHHYLIDTAIQNSDEVDVLVVDNPTYHIPATQRAKWLQEYHPTARVQIIPDINDDDNSPAWAQHTLQFLGYRPDMVFSSEPYGETWAAAMQCAESTGTTTLSKDLAHELRVPWVPELGRSYTESIAPTKSDWQDEDFYRIGQLQQAYENELATRSDGIIVCDTNATATELWQQRYMGATTKKMERIAAKDKADVYIITSDDIPFVQDGTRDGEHIRHQMHTWFITHIKKTGVPYIIVAGSRTERLAVAKKAATAMIATRRIIPGVV